MTGQILFLLLDYDIPNGNISYSGLNSKINKNETNYSDVFALILENSDFITLEKPLIDINVISETWKYEQKLLDNLSFFMHLAHFLYQKTIGYETFIHSFQEPDPYTENVLRKSIENIQKFYCR